MSANSSPSPGGTVSFLETLLQDSRFGLRFLARRPAFSVIVILVLGLGIGANTAMFSIVNAVLLRRLPYKDSERMVVVWQSSNQHRDTGEWFNTYSEFEEWQQKSRSFEKLAALSWAEPPKSLVWQGQRRKILAIPVSLDFLPMLGIAAEQGRTFEPQDLKEGCTVVLSHPFWQNDLGAPVNFPGNTLRVDDKDCRVAGIMPRDFSIYPAQTSLWMLITPDTAYVKDPWRTVTGVFGRLRPGVDRRTAQAELEILEANILPQAPSDLALPHAVPVVLEFQSEITWLAGHNLRSALIMLLAAVLAVLLIACVNVANLLLAQGADRRKELAIRTSLGCGRTRLIRQLLVESMLLSFSGAVVGVLVATSAVRIFNASNPIELPPGNPVEVNWQVLVFTVVLAILAAVLFGLVPAWRSSSLNVSEALKEAGHSLVAGRGVHCSRSFLVASEVALSLLLLAGAGLLLESLARLASAPLGFRTDHLLTAAIDLPEKKYNDAEKKIQFAQAATEQAASIAGVERATVASSPDLRGSNVLAVEGRTFSLERASHNVAEQTVEDGFREVMGIPLFQGRWFDSRERGSTRPVAVVNQALVDQYFPNESPLGRQIKLGRPESSEPWLTIVGIVANVKTTTVFQEMGFIVKPALYRPLAQDPLASMSLLIRTRGEPEAIAHPLQQKLLALDGDITVSDVKTMDERLSDLRSQPRFRTILLSVFAGLALLLAALGVYGLLMQSVIRRTKEIGIRMALGETRGGVIRRVLRQALTTVFAGIAIGLLATFFLARLVAGLLYDVHWDNPLILSAVSAILIVVSILASYFPARRASSVDPWQALRNE